MRLCHVPVGYLLNLFIHNDQSDKALYAYVQANLERLTAIHEAAEREKPATGRCTKQSFSTEKIAKIELQRIRKLEQVHKKPVRAYECDQCGAWHLTSIPFEKWDTGQRPAGVLEILANEGGMVEETDGVNQTTDKELCFNAFPSGETKMRCKRYTYASEREARYAVHQTEKRVVNFRNPVRAIECEKCGGWHLTSIPYERWEVHHKRGGLHDFIQFHLEAGQSQFD